MPRSRTRELGDTRARVALLFCPGGARGRKVRRNARKRFRASERTRCSLVKIARRNHYGLGESNSLSRRKFRVRGSLSTGESDWGKKRSPSNRRSIEKKHQSRIQPALGRVPTSGKRFAVDLPRSKILSTRLLFRAGPKVKELVGDRARSEHARPHGRTPSTTHVARTHAFRTTSSARGSIRTSLEPDTGRS